MRSAGADVKLDCGGCDGSVHYRNGPNGPNGPNEPPPHIGGMILYSLVVTLRDSVI